MPASEPGASFWRFSTFPVPTGLSLSLRRFSLPPWMRIAPSRSCFACGLVTCWHSPAKIQRETAGVVQSDLLYILQALGRRRYTARELAGVIPKETVMAGSLWAEAVSKGRKEGRMEGAREVCLDLAKQHHPDVADRVVPLIEACSDIERLHEWALQAPQLAEAAFLKLLTEQSGVTSGPSGRGRAPLPSRKAKPKRS